MLGILTGRRQYLTVILTCTSPIIRDPAVPLLGMYPRNQEHYFEKYVPPPVLLAASFTVAKTGKQHKCPSTGEWIKKMWCIYTMDGYSATKKNEYCLSEQHGWT